MRSVFVLAVVLMAALGAASGLMQEDHLGHPVELRDGRDVSAARTAYVDVALKFSHTGVVRSWDVVSEGALGRVVLQVWRPNKADAQQFRLVGQNTLDVETPGTHTLDVAPTGYIAFRQGDVVGWYIANATRADLSFTAGGTGNVLMTPGTLDGAPRVDDSLRFTAAAKRTYSVRANYAYDDAETRVDGDAHMLGHALSERPLHDVGANTTTHIDPAMRFPVAGVVEQWGIFGNRGGALKLQVYRPREVNGTTTYTLVGGNEVTATPGGLQYFPLSSEQEITVQPGDVVGWTDVQDGGVISYEVDPDAPHVLTQKGKVAREAGDAVTVSDGGARVYSIHAAFRLLRGPPTAENSRAVGAGVTHAVAGEETTFEIVTMDRYLNTMIEGGHLVRCLIKGDSGSNEPCAVEDLRNGVYRATYRITRAQRYTLSVQLQQQGEWRHVRGSSFRLRVVAARTAAAESTAQGYFTHSTYVDKRAQFVIKAADAFGNAKRVGGDRFVARIEGVEAHNASVTDLGDGTYGVEYRLLKKGDSLIHVMLDFNNTLTPIGGSPYALHIYSAGADPSKCNMTGDGLVGTTAGIPTRVLVQLFDKYSNVEDEGAEPCGVSLVGPGEAHYAVDDMGDGVYEVMYGSTVAGTYTMAVTIYGTNITGSPRSVYIKPAATVVSKSIAEGAGLHHAVAGEEASFVITARDEFENARDEGGDAFAVSVEGAASSASVQVHDNADGTYRVTYVARTTGRYTVYVGAADGSRMIRHSPWTLDVVPAPTNASTSPLVGVDALRVMEAGVLSTFEIDARDAFANKRNVGGDHFSARAVGPVTVEAAVKDDTNGSYIVSLAPTVQGAYEVHVTLTTQDGAKFPVMGSPIKVYVEASNASAAETRMDAFGVELADGVAGETSRFTIIAHDRYGNRRFKTGDAYRMELEGPIGAEQGDEDDDEHKVSWSVVAETGEAQADEEEAAAEAEAEAEAEPESSLPPKAGCDASEENSRKSRKDGTYSFQYTAKRAGQYQLKVYLGNKLVRGMPYNVTVAPAETAPARTEMTVDGWDVRARKAEAGVQAVMTLRMHDAFGNARAIGRDFVAVNLTGPVEMTVDVADHEDGSYEGKWVATAAGRYYLTVMVNSQRLPGAPLVVDVAPTDVSAKKSFAYGVGLYGGLATQNNTFVVQEADRFGNVRDNSSCDVTAFVRGEGFSADALVLDHTDGRHAVKWVVEEKGEYSLEVRINGDHIAGSPFRAEVRSLGCPDDCNGNGACRADGVCVCNAGFYGESCCNENKALKLDASRQQGAVVRSDAIAFVGGANAFTFEVTAKVAAAGYDCSAAPDGMTLLATEAVSLSIATCGDMAGRVHLKSGASEGFAHSTLAPRAWHSIAVVVKGGVARFFVNATADGQIAFSPSEATTDNQMAIGKAHGDGGAHFGGELDEIRVWNVALSEDEIRARLRIALSGEEDGLKAYFNFDARCAVAPAADLAVMADNMDTTAAAAGGPASHVPSHGGQSPLVPTDPLAPTHGQAAVPSPTPEPLPIDIDGETEAASDAPAVQVEPTTKYCLYLNGSAHAHIDAAPALDLTTFTIEAWIKPSKGGVTLVDKTMYMCAEKSESCAYRVVLGVPGVASDTRVGLWRDEQTTLFGSTYLPLNQWSHIAVTFNGSNAVVLVDGMVDGASSSWQPGSPNSADLLIGKAAPYEALFTGGMQEVRVWNSARSSEAIAVDMLHKLSPDSDGLVASWGMDSGSGSLLFDIGPSKLNGASDMGAWLEAEPGSKGVCAPVA